MTRDRWSQTKDYSLCLAMASSDIFVSLDQDYYVQMASEEAACFQSRKQRRRGLLLGVLRRAPRVFRSPEPSHLTCRQDPKMKEVWTVDDEEYGRLMT